jgi:YfiH family protein
MSSVIHGVFTRQGGVSEPPFASLNASASTGDDPAAVARNKEVIAAAMEVTLASMRPVHGSRVAEVGPDAPEVGKTPGWRSLAGDADGMMTDVPGIGLFWAFADCVPIILHDPAHRCIALVHAGWRGTAEAIAWRAVQAMGRRYGSRPEDVMAGIAPSIGKCCYRVSDEVERRFSETPEAWASARFEDRAIPDAAHAGPAQYLDLWESNRGQLLAAGLAPEHIEVAGICTGCRTDLFFSHRVEPKPTGRFAVVAGLAAA